MLVEGESPSAIIDVVRRFWGFERLRPLQAQAIEAGIDRRDSLVVMPTGGGKSLCYQVPPEVAQRTDIVISPLISLMKDQVDGLQGCGYPAAAMHSQLDAAERREVDRGLRANRYRLLFVSPERLLAPWFLQIVQGMAIGAVAVDEAHCISHWGHDFRPDYRQLARLKELLPGVSIHAFTATATPRVRQDISQQLGLDDPTVLVGRFDRPNLAYRIVPRVDRDGQVLEILARHDQEAAIVYCLTRADTEQLADRLKAAGVQAAAYHAGMPGMERRRIQEAFAGERLDVVVATVAFGMGIDRSDVRCVIHAAMPQSVEHFQQETGRAGRDGLEAECVLLYSAADVLRWQGLIDRKLPEGEGHDEVRAARHELVRHMQGLCSTLECRHRALSRYFGQDYPPRPCEACDVCLGEAKGMPDATVTAQKILSGVARLGQRFGVGHLVQVLRGAETDAIRRWGHDQLSTYGLMEEVPQPVVTNLVYQLIDQGLLQRSSGDRPVVQLGPDAAEVLRGQRAVKLLEPKAAKVRRSRADVVSWEGVDRGLFDHLRQCRRRIAEERGVPAYVIFGDATLRELARVRPTTLQLLRTIHGVGERKLADLGPVFLEAITSYCREHGLGTDGRGD